MDVLIILIAIIGIATSVANKKKMAEAQRQRPAARQREAAGTKPTTSQSTQSKTSSSKSPAAPSKFPPAGPSKFPPVANKRQQVAAQKTQTKPNAPAYGGTPRYTHVVTSTLEGGHTHTESSMTGEEACPPPQAGKEQHEVERTSVAAAGGLLDFQANSVLQGVLFSEILGKPKALQRD